jgi:hypothetical protein
MNTKHNTLTNTTPVHAFERAGLGEAPFRCVGKYVSLFQACQGAPVRAGSSCDYCGTSIAQVYRIRGADGAEFKVGCDCVAKTGDQGLRRQVNALVSKARRETADAHAAALVTEAEAALARPEVAARLAAEVRASAPAWLPAEERTALAYVRFLLDRGGRAGRTKGAKLVLAAAK